MNCVIVGWVSLAMETVIKVLFPELTLFGRTSFDILGFEFSAALVLVSLLVLVVAGIDATWIAVAWSHLVFVLPYEGRYSLIGTTEVDYQGDPGEVQPVLEERGDAAQPADVRVAVEPGPAVGAIRLDEATTLVHPEVLDVGADGVDETFAIDRQMEGRGRFDHPAAGSIGFERK